MNKNGFKSQESFLSQEWRWWPLLPLYPYGKRKTICQELIPGQVWSLEQLQGLYYVAVPIRLTVVKVSGGLMLFNPLPPTKELLENLSRLISAHGPVKTIVLPTASGLEHKISLPALARAFPEAALWLCPGQWSFPISLPSSWLGIPKAKTKILLEDGIPHENECLWISLGPLNIGLGRFQEISCYHKKSKSLLVTDSLVGISSNPPALFNLDPTPLLFHARDKGNDPLIDTRNSRKKGWARLVLFASFLRPNDLSIPPITSVLSNSLKPGLRNLKSHFGFYPFAWDDGWDNSLGNLLGEERPLLQIAPVLERLVFPRAKESFLEWLEKIISIRGINWLIPAHYNAPLKFNSREIRGFKNKIKRRDWAPDNSNWKFLGFVDKTLLERGVVPADPTKGFIN